MRDLLRLPALFLFFLVLLLLLLTGIDILATWGAGLSAGREEALALAGARTLMALQDALPISVLLALVVLLFRTTLKPGNRFLTFLVPLVVSFVVLAFGYQALASFQSRSESRRVQAAQAAYTPERFLAEGRFVQAGEQVLYLSALDGRAVEGIVLYDPQAKPPKLRFFPRGQLVAVEGGVRLGMSGTTRNLRIDPLYGPLFA